MVEVLKEKVEKVVKELYNLKLPEKTKFEVPKNKSYGDASTNIAFLLAKFLRKNPKDIAQEIANRLKEDEIFEKVEVINNFINIKYSSKYYSHLLSEINKPYFFLEGIKEISISGKIQYEYVSANPTGPLHLGHARGAIIGDVLTTILKRAKEYLSLEYQIDREFYINDAGRQVKLLTASVLLRIFTLDKNDLSWEELVASLENNKEFLSYLKEIGISLEELKEEGYRGEYVKDIARDYLKTYSQIDIFKLEDFSLNWALNNIKKDLKDLGVEFDIFFSEKSLYSGREFHEALNLLKPYIYEKEGALWLKTSLFGDDKDRVLRKSNGDWTYFAGDIAYHYSKLKRGYTKIVNIWGHDHHGYVKRLKIATFLLDCLLNGKDPEREFENIKNIDNYQKLDVILVQLVKLFRNGQEVKMSKRKGTFVTLRELLDEVGKDPIRFIFLTKSHETPLDFDIELAKKEVNENPVYYVKYAHARIASILRKAKNELNLDWNVKDFNPEVLNEEEKNLLKNLFFAKEIIKRTIQKQAPHLIPYYLLDLASNFHKYYSSYKILGNEKSLTLNRLILISAVKKVLKELLDILKVNAPEKM